MTLVEQINAGIKDSMKSKNQLRLNTLRMLKSKILAVDARCELADSEIVKLFKTYFGNLQEAFEQAQAAGRSEMASTLKEEMQIVQEFLPKAPSLEETKKIVKQAVEETGARSPKELGLVMKSILKLNSAVDAKLAKDLASELLNPNG